MWNVPLVSTSPLPFKVCWVVMFILLNSNSDDSNQMPHSVVSDLGLHCLPMSHKKDARLKGVNFN